MTEVRKVIRAFLASPGGLDIERKIARDVVNEFNEIWADQLGFQVELMGWEETVAGFGRAQELINQDVDKCDLFIGMMWNRWGTPPDTEGKYTSGFHEEFDRCMQRRETAGQPEICIYFKDVPEEQLADPGQELGKVLAFKKQIIDEKKILFQNFSDGEDIAALIRKRVSRFVFDIRNRELDALEAVDESKPTLLSDARSLATKSGEVDSPFSPEGFDFLQNFVDRIHHKDALKELQAVDIARIRLLSNSISKAGNDGVDVGVHDLNLLFTNRFNLTLGEVEIRTLTKLGLRYLRGENVPLWYWLHSGSPSQLAWSSEFGDSKQEKIGAITTLDWLRMVPYINEIFDKQFFISSWFGESSSSDVKNAAIEYLKNNGTDTDINFVQAEYELNNSSTSRNALQVVLSLTTKFLGPKEASKLVIKFQFDLINPEILSEALVGFEDLDTDLLILGAKHRNATVRLHAINILIRHSELPRKELTKFQDDANAEIRYLTLMKSINNGLIISNSEVKKILIKPNTRPNYNMFQSRPGSDTEGERFYQKFMLDQLRCLSKKRLTERVDTASMYEAQPYLVMVEKYFVKWSRDLRSNVDNQFELFFSKQISQFAEMLDGHTEVSSAVSRARKLEDFVRKGMTRDGLDVLCRKRNKEDLARIRRNLESGYAGATIEDATYLKKYGQWSDVPLLANANPLVIRQGIQLGESGSDFDNAVIEAIYKIGRVDISRLFSIDLPDKIKNGLLTTSADSAFRDIEKNILLDLFNDKSNDIRKSAALKVVSSFTIKQIKELLAEYEAMDQSSYYNVIHWLDLGASTSLRNSRLVTQAVMA